MAGSGSRPSFPTPSPTPSSASSQTVAATPPKTQASNTPSAIADSETQSTIAASETQENSAPPSISTPAPSQTPAITSSFLLSEPASDPPNVANTLSTLLDREQRAIAEMLSRYKNIISLSAMESNDGASATREVAAGQAFALEVESAALVRAAEDLLRLSRELKEMWLFGPLRGVGEGEGEGTIDDNAQKVGEMVEAILKSAGASTEGSGS